MQRVREFGFHMLKEFVNSGCSRWSSLWDGLHKYRGNFVSDNTMRILWIPGHAVSFMWTMLPSYHRGSAGPASKAPDA